jgi:hypothetical protein
MRWDFSGCIRPRRLTVGNPEVMVRSMNNSLAADLCAPRKRNLQFDLIKAEFVGDSEANGRRRAATRSGECREAGPYLQS